MAYEKDGVKITHWRQSHVTDGASAYRLDWNGMCVAFTGDGRPNSLTLKYAKGCDLVITEVQPELLREWPSDRPVFLPKDKVPPGLWLHGKPAVGPEENGTSN